jgi:sulfatase modifying factor 1
MKLRHTVCLAALLVCCHRDLDVAPAPACAHEATGCVDAAADADGEPVDTAIGADSVAEAESDSTMDAADAEGDSAMDGADSTVDSNDAAETAADTAMDACSTMTCTTPPAAGCASTTSRRTYASTGTCSGGTCSYAPTDTACPAGEICSGGVCSPPSCAGGLTCGTVSCCESKSIPAGTFPMGRATTGPEADACTGWASADCPPPADEQPEHTVTVSSLRLDTFEVTVGRMRKFVAGYPGNKPAAGAGAHPLIAGSGWQSAWDPKLPVSLVDLKTALKCELGFTWTDAAGTTENRPINCVDWYLAFAFCAWDGGRLPTEAEWEYAAAGGSENRVLPWGNTAPSSSLASYGCITPSSCPLPAVGNTPLGVSRWGQHDLGGSVWEWNLDWSASYTAAPTTNPAQLATGSDRVWRGGAFLHPSERLRAAARGALVPEIEIAVSGVRCARNP